VFKNGKAKTFEIEPDTVCDGTELKFDAKYNPNNIEIDQFLFLSMLSSQYAYKNSYTGFYS
jgi:hypothetical protein